MGQISIPCSMVGHACRIRFCLCPFHFDLPSRSLFSTYLYNGPERFLISAAWSCNTGFCCLCVLTAYRECEVYCTQAISNEECGFILRKCRPGIFFRELDKVGLAAVCLIFLAFGRDVQVAFSYCLPSVDFCDLINQ